ncbi:unnamed protein product [Cyclocybe aegerita]|uniref:Serine aminopeptidase S33 domain-containing protein n=1 Tax=Cyclocybe aegerita TaxID=1973307 RepID=A0A8S0X783_CYCAE|nr:unnamed protein product [Cyclocybe aegerita]
MDQLTILLRVVVPLSKILSFNHTRAASRLPSFSQPPSVRAMGLFWMFLKYNQRLLVYPDGFHFDNERREIMTPLEFFMPYEDVELRTKDKVTLRCYLMLQTSKAARATVIMFHGNATNQGEVLDLAHRFHRANFHVFTLEYRGYGLSDGAPSESGIRLDAQAALDFVSGHPTLSQLPIVIYGQSLGGGVAIDATSRNSGKIKALIIENTFTSIPNVIKGWHVIGYFSFLATQRWPSASRLESIPASLPILMLSGTLDAVIPQHHMHTLWDVASKRGQPKGNLLNAVTCGTMSRRGSMLVAEDEEVSGKECGVPAVKDKFKKFSRGSHNDTCLQPEYWTTVFDFLDDILS